MQSLTCTETAPHWPTNTAPLLDWWSSRSPALKNGSKTLQPTATDIAALGVQSFLFFFLSSSSYDQFQNLFATVWCLNAMLNAVITIRRSLQQTFNSSISKGSDQELGGKKKKLNFKALDDIPHWTDTHHFARQLSPQSLELAPQFARGGSVWSSRSPLAPREARQEWGCFSGLGFRGRFSFRASQTEALSLFMALIRGKAARSPDPSRPPGEVGSPRAGGDSRPSGGQGRAARPQRPTSPQGESYGPGQGPDRRLGHKIHRMTVHG